MMGESSVDDEKLKEIVGKNPLMDKADEESKEHERYEVFCAIDKLVQAARSLYCDEEMTFDEMVDNLSKAISKLKGKEDELYDYGEEDSEDDDKSED